MGSQTIYCISFHSAVKLTQAVSVKGVLQKSISYGDLIFSKYFSMLKKMQFNIIVFSGFSDKQEVQKNNLYLKQKSFVTL